VVPVVEALAALGMSAAISIDTRKAEVAKACLAVGAHIVNDVTALGDPEMAATIVHHDAAVILMHMRGEPRTMQQGELHYDDVTATVVTELERAAAKARSAGIGRILVDPGIGFGKTAAHNLVLTKTLAALARLGPVVYGASRKRFLGELTGRDAGDRERATAAISALAVVNGASIIRVHDVAACIDALKIATAVRHAKSTP
jgi:dihydropteroate synthase